MISAEDRRRIREALVDRSVRRLERVVVTLILAGEHATEVEQVMRDELAAAPHDVHEWWHETCECTPEPVTEEAREGANLT